MKHSVPRTPFSTRLSGSARELELRLRSIFQWQKKRPPIILFLLTIAALMSCFGLVSCQVEEEPPMDHAAPESKDGENAVTPPGAADANDRPDLGLPDVIELSTPDGKTHPARRFDGDGWCIYIPEGWYKENVWDRWSSQYGTGASLSVDPCTDRMEDIKGYYGELGAWPYDTDMESPYDSYYLLNPLGGDAQHEMFFVPVSETSSYTLSCRWDKSTQRAGERELLHAMVSSFTVDEGITRAPATESSLAVQDVLKNLTMEHTASLTRVDGDTAYEMSQRGKLFEMLRSASDSLHPIDRPEEFSALPGVVSLHCSDGAYLSFWAGEFHPSVLVRYVSDTAEEYAVAEDFSLYTLLLAGSEQNYLELHDFEGDGSYEAVVWRAENNRRSVAIYDYYNGEPQCVDVNGELSCAASDHTGQIGNIKREYSNMLSVTTDSGERLIYSYDSGQFTYVCTLSEALLS